MEILERRQNAGFVESISVLENTYGEDWHSSAFGGTGHKCKFKRGANPSMLASTKSLKFG